MSQPASSPACHAWEGGRDAAMAAAVKGPALQGGGQAAACEWPSPRRSGPPPPPLAASLSLPPSPAAARWTTPSRRTQRWTLLPERCFTLATLSTAPPTVSRLLPALEGSEWQSLPGGAGRGSRLRVCWLGMDRRRGSGLQVAWRCQLPPTPACLRAVPLQARLQAGTAGWTSRAAWCETSQCPCRR